MKLIPPSRVLLQTSKKLTAAQKSLSKVDKKGMKSLSSFFGAGTKKTKKSQQRTRTVRFLGKTLPFLFLLEAVVLLLWHVKGETLQQGKTGRDDSCIFFILLPYDQNFSWYKLPVCFCKCISMLWSYPACLKIV